MSNLGARVQKARETAQAPLAAPEPREYRGWVVRSINGGMEWCRVAIPESVLRQYMVGSMQPPDVRAIVSAKIETELTSDAFTEKRGWPG